MISNEELKTIKIVSILLRYERMLALLCINCSLWCHWIKIHHSGLSGYLQIFSFLGVTDWWNKSQCVWGTPIFVVFDLLLAINSPFYEFQQCCCSFPGIWFLVKRVLHFCWVLTQFAIVWFASLSDWSFHFDLLWLFCWNLQQKFSKISLWHLFSLDTGLLHINELY